MASESTPLVPSPSLSHLDPPYVLSLGLEHIYLYLWNVEYFTDNIAVESHTKVIFHLTEIWGILLAIGGKIIFEGTGTVTGQEKKTIKKVQETSNKKIKKEDGESFFWNFVYRFLL